MRKKCLWAHAVTMSSLFFFFSLSWHLWVGFPWPKFPLSEPVPCRQPTTSMQWQFKSVRLTGSGCDSGRRAPAGKDANATCRAVLWQKVRGTRRCGASGSFLSVSPGIRPSFSASRLVRETGAGAVPGPFASQRARERERLALKWCHPHALTAAEDLSRALLCKEERKSPTLIQTSDGGWSFLVLSALRAGGCSLCLLGFYIWVHCTSTLIGIAILQLEHERDGLMDSWRKCSSLNQVVPASSALYRITKFVSLGLGEFVFVEWGWMSSYYAAVWLLTGIPAPQFDFFFPIPPNDLVKKKKEEKKKRAPRLISALPLMAEKNKITYTFFILVFSDDDNNL